VSLADSVTAAVPWLRPDGVLYTHAISACANGSSHMLKENCKLEALLNATVRWSLQGHTKGTLLPKDGNMHLHCWLLQMLSVPSFQFTLGCESCHFDSELLSRMFLLLAAEALLSFIGARP